MTAFDEIWLKPALVDLAEIPQAGREQIETLVREMCRDPYAVGRPFVAARPDMLGRDRQVVEGLAEVHYRVIDDMDRIVYVCRALWDA